MGNFNFGECLGFVLLLSQTSQLGDVRWELAPFPPPKPPVKTHTPLPQKTFLCFAKKIAKTGNKSKPPAASPTPSPAARRLAPGRCVLSRQGSPPSHPGHRDVAQLKKASPPAPARSSSEAGSRTAPRRHLLPPSPPSQRQPRGPSCSSRPRALVAASSPPTSRYIRGGANCFVLYPSISSLYCGVAWNPPVRVDAATQARAC
jgi:hypothetical protein